MLRPKLKSVEALEKCRLLITYENGEKKIFDVTPYAEGPWFGRLGDPAYFALVRVLPDRTGIEWPDGQDIAPHELYELSQALGA